MSKYFKQIFGFTQLHQAPPGKMVTFITASVSEEDGEVMVAIRNDAGEFNVFYLSPQNASELASVISTAVFPHLPTARKE